ncbi:MAG TPA: polyprenyl synthetase family protein [Acidobacteriota bacterium]|nr:polyprenyl synthetase family protein [Acidobacteriota bacterium]
MTSFEDFSREKQKLIEARLQHLVPSAETEPRKLHESVRYSLFADAKRIRPIFALAVASLFRVHEEEMTDAACTLEMVHTSSLILDDLPSMDGATMRRGKPANHIVFGEDTAILAAMYLLNRAYGILADYRKAFFSPTLATQFASILSRAISSDGLIGGQLVDLASKNKEIDLETLEFIHSRKTGALFSASAEMACSFAKARDLDRQVVLNFAKNLGLAFQITDDILDATSDPKTIGKDTGKDTGKTTFITFCGVEGARKLADELIDTAEQSLRPLKNRAQLLLSFASFVRNRTR